MEWFWVILVIYWLINGLSSDDSSDDNEDEETSGDEESEYDEDELEEELETEDKKIKEKPNTMPTVTRVSGADLQNSPVNRPTVINREK